MTEIVLLIVALVTLVGGVVLILIRMRKFGINDQATELEALRVRAEALSAEVRVLEERNRGLQQQLDDAITESRVKDQTILSLTGNLSRREAEHAGLEKRLADQRMELESMQERLKTEFKNLASEILEDKSKRFTEQNKTKLEEILKPLGEKIREFEKRVEETYDKESKQRFSLEKEIRNLAELNQQIGKEAGNLTRALKGQAKTQGNWGEVILESILEKSGLVRDREYVIQPSFTGPDGRRLQPDVVVTYPGNRSVVIDSKVSLVAYERFSSSDDREEQEKALRDHLISVRNHINELASKNYQDLYQLHSLDFVMLFMPVEPAYMAAMQQDPALWNFAYERRVLMISPTNLIAALKMISNLWRVEYQNKNAQEIARQSADLLDKFSSFLDDLQDIGRKIEATRSSHEAAMNKLSTGKGNLIRRAEKLKELGARPSKELPKSLLEKADEE